MPRITPLAICAILLCLSLPAGAQVVMDHLLGKYATTKEFCADPAMQVFEIRRGIVEGPNFLCILGAKHEAGTGLEAYEAKCTQGDRVHLGALTFDLSDTEDHIRISLPPKQDWITLYPCK